MDYVQTQQPEIDTQKVETFAGWMTDALNKGALVHMICLGHRTRLFDTMSELPPATSAQVAEAAGLNERYVREWLNAMVAGRVVDYDPQLQIYHLSAEHAALLTRVAGADNLAIYTQHVSNLATVQDQIEECFHHGGGVHYTEFHHFHEIMEEDSNVNIVDALESTILPLVSGLSERLEAGIEVLDLGCGRGNALKRMAQLFPNSRFTGIDFSQEAIEFAQADVERMKLQNLRFQVQDAATFAATEQYELITTFDAIHDQAHPLTVLGNIYRALKPDGVYLMQDIAGSSHVHNNLEHPLAPLLYTISTMHCMTVSLANGGEGLGTMWGKEKALELLAQAGFTDTAVHQLEHDIFNYYYISTKQM